MSSTNLANTLLQFSKKVGEDTKTFHEICSMIMDHYLVILNVLYCPLEAHKE